MSVIIGTAGHIDHGKSALVYALTLVDTDRLQEEKLRGITIDLGFAYKPIANGDILGFVDVPGHERFIHNMLAGATGIDYVMLVIAANDGVMPQTLEHLAIIDQLGLKQGIVALTKSDLVDDKRIEEVTKEIQALLSNTTLANTQIMPVSTVSGQGIDALNLHLTNMAISTPKREQNGNFRLSVDRCFTLSGIGTVVTGTVFAGKVTIGDKLLVSPAGFEVRVRGIHAQNQIVDTGYTGQRCALNLTAPGLEKKDINRGDWIIAPSIHAPSNRLDAKFTVLNSENKQFRHWQSVHLHLGAIDVLARVATLENEAIAPGHDGLVQLVVDTPIAAIAGDRFIIRDPSATRTIGGGIILDTFANERGRRKPKRLNLLNALALPTKLEVLNKLLEINTYGVDLDWFRTLFNLDQREIKETISASGLIQIVADKHTIGFSQTHWKNLQDQAVTILQAHHVIKPDSPGLTLDELRNKIDKSMAKPVMAILVEHLLIGKQIIRAGVRVACPEHEVKLTSNEQVYWEQLYALLLATPLSPPTLTEMLPNIALNELQLISLVNRLVTMGKIYKVRSQQYFLAETIANLGINVEQLAISQAPERFTMAQFRVATNVGRGVAIPLLELYDRIGLTVRYNNGRRLRRDWQSIFGVAKNV